MTEVLAGVTLVVREYDEAIKYFTTAVGFRLVEDTPLPGGKRWVRVAPDGRPGPSILLARAATPLQERSVGNQTGGRVSFFLHTVDFRATYQKMRERGVVGDGDIRWSLGSQAEQPGGVEVQARFEASGDERVRRRQ